MHYRHPVRRLVVLQRERLTRSLGARVEDVPPHELEVVRGDRVDVHQLVEQGAIEASGPAADRAAAERELGSLQAVTRETICDRELCAEWQTICYAH